MQNWKEGCVFGHIDNFWKGHDGQIKKNMQKHLFRVYFHTWKVHVRGVFWKSFYEDDIEPEIQVPPPQKAVLQTAIQESS